MINKRLLNLVPEAKKFIYLNVIFQIIGLVSNVFFISEIGKIIIDHRTTWGFVIFVILVKIASHYLANWMSYLSSVKVKIRLRELLFNQVLRIGSSVSSIVSDSELIQLSGEGIEQLEIYFSSYIPQFFYSMIAPIILFGFVVFRQVWVAVVLLVCVPLIPVSIVLIQRFAKKLLNKYWGIYTGLGDTFLDSLQGLFTLKLFKFDEQKQSDLEEESEKFRKVTMRVLLMQLNSISVMDLVAYGGAMVAIVVALNQSMNLIDFLFVILICAEFFLPMRLLGSYFHVAMNGASAAEKIFKVLDYDVEAFDYRTPNQVGEGFELRNFSYRYDREEALSNLNFTLRKGDFIGVVGMSGSGKSTLTNVLMKHLKSDGILFGDTDLKNVNIMQYVTMVSHDSTIFKGTIRDLLGGKDDQEMKDLLNQLNLDFDLNDSLDFLGSNVSGGERQRLALCRALLRNTDYYIFDEITAAVDFESEAIIMKVIDALAQSGKGILLISHRISNVFNCTRIEVLEHGKSVGSGTHLDLMKSSSCYKDMVNAQAVYEVSL